MSTPAADEPVDPAEVEPAEVPAAEEAAPGEAVGEQPAGVTKPDAEASEDPAVAAVSAQMNALLDAGREALAADARAWAAQVHRVLELMEASEAAGPLGVRQFPHLEIAGSWLVSQHSAGSMMTEARRLQEALPRTLELLGSGQLLRRQAWVLLKKTEHCPVGIARQVEAEVLADPTALTLIPADLGKRVARQILEVESEQTSPDAAEERHATAVAERRTFVRAEQDGMGVAGAVLPAEKLIGWQAALDALERRERRADRAAGIDRSADQRRADIFAALPAMALAGLQLADTARQAARDVTADEQLDLGIAAGLGGRPWTFSPDQVAATVVVNVHVPVSTVLELTRQPGTLDRYGPISAEHIRLLRPRAWRRVMVGGDTGRPIAVDERTTPVDPDPEAAREQVQQMLQPATVLDADEPQHDPSARLARLIDLRDVHCTGPGCSVSRCDRDHDDPWPHGATSASNLQLLSERCHAAKHHGWTLQRHPDGSVTWRSPLRREYDRPGPHTAPPRTDLYADPPPLRPRPSPPPPRWLGVDDGDSGAEKDAGVGGNDMPATNSGTGRTGFDAARDGVAETDADTTPDPDDDPPPF